MTATGESARTRSGEIAVVAMASLLIFLIPMLFNSHFYFYDDFQIQYLPTFHEIGRLLADGQLPFVTLKNWFSGALLGEYQYGIFNPINLILFLFIDLLADNVVWAATFFSVFHLVVLTTGVYAACRAADCDRRPAAIAAVAVGTASWQLYWYAISWVPGLVGCSWLAWTVAAVLALRRGANRVVLPCLAIYMPLVSGWPQAVIAEAIFLGAVIGEAALARQWRFAVRVGMLALLGLMLAMPALLPLVYYKAVGARGSGWAGPIFAWLASPAAWLGMGFPSFITSWQGWPGYYGFIDNPMTYHHWTLPMVAIVVVTRYPTALRDRSALLFASLAGIFAATAMVPFPLPISVKWPFRFIPFADLFLMLWLARVLSLRERSGLTTSGWSRRLLVGCILLPLFLTVTGGSGYLDKYAVPFVLRDIIVALLLFAGGFLVIATDRLASRYWMVTVLGVHIVFFALIIAFWPVPRYLHDWGVPANAWTSEARDEMSRRLAVSDGGNAIFLYGTQWDPDQFSDRTALGRVPPVRRQPWKLFGNMPFYYGISAIEGYSPIEPAALGEFFCFGPFAATLCPGAIDHLFATEPTVGVAVADLFRLDRVVAEAGPLNTAAASGVPVDWTRTDLGDGDTLYVRPSAAQRAPGTISYLPPGVTASLVRFSDRGEAHRVVVSASYDGKPMVFARSWYPGYEIMADGVALPYELIEGIFLAVRLPQNFAGELVVAYTPRGLLPGLAVAGVALVLLMIWWWLERRRLIPLRT